MRSIVSLCRSMALALLVVVAGCSPGPGQGLLVLSVTADTAVPAGAANKVVLLFPGELDRTYAGAFPRENNAPLVLQFPNLPEGQVTVTVRATAPDGCPVAEASKRMVVQGGARTNADLVLTKSTGTCGDGGTPPDAAPLDAAIDQRNADAPLGETNLSLDAPPADTPRTDTPGEAGHAPDDATDTPMGAGGAGGSGGPGTGGAGSGGGNGSGGISTGGAPATGGATGTGGSGTGGSGTGGAPSTGGSGTGGAPSTGGSGTGGAPSTGGSGTGGSGTGGAPSTGGSGTGGSGTGGAPSTGGSGTGGSGTGGAPSNGGSGTGGSGSGGTPACQKGRVTASQVVIMGESFYAMAPKYIEKRIEAQASAAGAIGPIDVYRNVAVSGQAMSYIASTEWDNVKNSTVKVVIMDGGALDCMTSSCPTCPATFQTLLGKMATAGVEDVIYTRMPEPGNPPGANATVKGNYDILFPQMETVCAAATGLRCHWVDLRPVWTNGDTTDGLHPTESGGIHVGDAIWAEMVKDCIAQ